MKKKSLKKLLEEKDKVEAEFEEYFAKLVINNYINAILSLLSEYDKNYEKIMNEYIIASNDILLNQIVNLSKDIENEIERIKSGVNEILEINLVVKSKEQIENEYKELIEKVRKAIETLNDLPDSFRSELIFLNTAHILNFRIKNNARKLVFTLLNKFKK